MPEPVEGAEKGAKGAGDVLTRKLGPLPLWAWAAGVGAAFLLVRMVRGGGGSAPMIAGVSGRMPDTGVAMGGGVPTSVGPQPSVASLTPGTATGGQSFLAPPPLLGPSPQPVTLSPSPAPVAAAPPSMPVSVAPVLPPQTPPIAPASAPVIYTLPASGVLPTGQPVNAQTGSKIEIIGGQPISLAGPYATTGITPLLAPSSGVGSVPAISAAGVAPPAPAPSSPAFVQSVETARAAAQAAMVWRNAAPGRGGEHETFPGSGIWVAY